MTAIGARDRAVILLGYASALRPGELSALDLADIPPTAHPLPLVNVLRRDEVRPTLPRDEVLAAAPEAEDGRFRVPRILDGE